MLHILDSPLQNALGETNVAPRPINVLNGTEIVTMIENVKMVWRAARIIAHGNMDINGTRKMIAVTSWVRRHFHSSFNYLRGLYICKHTYMQFEYRLH